MLEASLTHDLIYMAWQNVVVGFCDGKPKICAAIRKFLAENTAYVRSMVARLERDTIYCLGNPNYNNACTRFPQHAHVFEKVSN